jgi:hypothetical protein
MLPSRRISGLLLALATVGLAVAPVPARSQAPPPSPAPSPQPCTAPEYRQFDFWLGAWNVYGPDGSLAGTNEITSEFDGCVLQEHWAASPPPPQRGSSFNTWSPANRKWHQTWVDSTGGFLLLDGEFRDGTMVLAGEMPARDGGRINHRITWSQLPGGRVRQFWESSRDDGKTWRVVFDGIYVRQT